MQAPLRRGKKETLGRAKGVRRTGRSLLFGSLLVAIVSASGMFYTYERLIVESMLEQNMALEGKLEAAKHRTQRLAFEVASLGNVKRIEAAGRDLGMAALNWSDVVVIGEIGGPR